MRGAHRRQAALGLTSSGQHVDQCAPNLLQGQDCFGAFMAWGLPKEVLREIWALVAGSQGQLDKHQFVSALYLMDSVKKVGKGGVREHNYHLSMVDEPAGCLRWLSWANTAVSACML